MPDIATLYGFNFPEYFKQVAIALFPMLFLFGIFQILRLHLRTKTILKIGVGTIYTYLGLVLFLTSVNVAFMPAGYQIGNILVENNSSWVLIVVGLAIGYFVVAAEPAVFILKRQVEEVTAGAISAKAIGIGLSVGVAVSVGLAMFRIVTGLSILYFVIPGYVIALVLTFFIPPLFISIAFDSGRRWAPLLQHLCCRCCQELVRRRRQYLSDAFGIVAFVAMTRLLRFSCSVWPMR